MGFFEYAKHHILAFLLLFLGILLVMLGISADIIGLNTESSINVFGVPLLIIGAILTLAGFIYVAYIRYKYPKR